MNEPITFITILFDGRKTGVPRYSIRYSPEWVDKLYRGFARHVDQPFEMVCLADREYEFKEPVRQVLFGEQHGAGSGWSCIMESFPAGTYAPAADS